MISAMGEVKQNSVISVEYKANREGAILVKTG